jgi:hypothetical protein
MNFDDRMMRHQVKDIHSMYSVNRIKKISNWDFSRVFCRQLMSNSLNNDSKMERNENSRLCPLDCQRTYQILDERSNKSYSVRSASI